MSQKDIKLYQGSASPKDIVLRALEAAPLQARNTIYLYEGHATPKNVILRNPAAVPAAGSVTGTIAFTQEQNTWAATAAVLVAGTISWTQSDDTWAVEGTVVDATPAAQPGYDGGSYARQRGLGRFGPPRTQRLRHAVAPEERVFVGKSRAQVLELQLLLLG